MSDRPETPFDDIESAQEYLHLLLEAISEAQQQVECEIAFAGEPQIARRKQALQLASYNLAKLCSHITVSRRILNDLRSLRRLLLAERKPEQEAVTAKS